MPIELYYKQRFFFNYELINFEKKKTGDLINLC